MLERGIDRALPSVGRALRRRPTTPRDAPRSQRCDAAPDRYDDDEDFAGGPGGYKRARCMPEVDLHVDELPVEWSR